MTSKTHHLGVLGGAFDPFHNAHFNMAQSAKNQLNLDEVMLVPTFVPAHKNPAWLSFEHRLAMLKAVASKYPWLSVTDIEAHLPTPSYTVKTLQALLAQHAQLQQNQPAHRNKLFKDLKLTLILGEDAYESLQSWFEWQSLASLCKIAVFARHENKTKEIKLGLPATWLTTPIWTLSSTLIRQKYAQGQSIRHLVPAAVDDWLQSNASNTTAANAATSGISNTMTNNKAQKTPKKQNLLKLIEQQLDDQKGKEIEVIDLQGAAQFADTMVVASGTSTRHVASLARGVCDKVQETLNQKPIGIEGLETSEWVLVDFGETIVHVMLPATRQFYELEKLWKARPDQSQATPEE